MKAGAGALCEVGVKIYKTDMYTGIAAG